MANTDKDKGYTRIPNDVLDAILTHGFNYTQLMIVLYVLRKTAGWNKARDSVAVSQIAQKVGRSRKFVSKSVKELEDMKVLNVSRPRNGIPPVVSVNSPDKWKPVNSTSHGNCTSHVNSTSQNLRTTVHRGVNSTSQVPVNSTSHTKDNIKDTYTKERKKGGFTPQSEELEPDDEYDLEGWEDP